MCAQRTRATPADSQADTGPSEEAPGIQKDDAFHLLQNSRRRAVLRYLLDHPEKGQFRMRDLAEEVAAWEHDTTVQRLSSDERQRVYIALYQSHLPKLDDHGIISYNQSRGVVEPTPLIRLLEPFLEPGLEVETTRLTLEGSSTSSSRSDERSTGTVVDTLSNILNG